MPSSSPQTLKVPPAATPEESFVEACYRVLLRREPDPHGTASHLKALRSGSRNFRATLEAFVRSHAFASHIRQFAIHYCSAKQPNLLFLDSTQNGEFRHIIKWLVTNGSRHRLIVDVGAHGRRGSNSYDLMRHFDWRGLLVEANPNLLAVIRKEFDGLQFDLVQTAVGTTEGHTSLYFGVNSGISSIRETQVGQWGPVKGSTRVPLERLHSVLDRNRIPLDFDILSLDIESLDVEVFNDLIANSAYRPRFVIIEIVRAAEVKDLATRKFSSAVSAQYKVWGHCGPNLFLERIDAAS
jgi:FkbM family methyltransferase